MLAAAQLLCVVKCLYCLLFFVIKMSKVYVTLFEEQLFALFVVAFSLNWPGAVSVYQSQCPIVCPFECNLRLRPNSLDWRLLGKECIATICILLDVDFGLDLGLPH